MPLLPSSPPASAHRRFAWMWAIVPILALLFALNAGREWPYHAGAVFPRPVQKNGETIYPSGKSAEFTVFLPEAGTMRLEAAFLTAAGREAPPLHVSVSQSGKSRSFSVATRPGGKAGISSATVPLALLPGSNKIVLTIEDALPFCMTSLHLVQNMLTAGNVRLCLALVSLVIASILAARALGFSGLDLFPCAAPIAFLIITSSATLLSYLQLLTSGMWLTGILCFSLIISSVAIVRLRLRPNRGNLPEIRLQTGEIIFLFAFILPVFMVQILRPISKWDDLMYHGSRAAYWMANASALPFIVHDDRLTVFPLGGDLINAFGVIVSHAEMPGKFLVFLAYPLTLFCLLALLKNAGVRSAVALGVVAIFATTPLVMANAIGIKPDLWLVLLGVVTLHFVLAARRRSSFCASCLAAASAGAALGIKWTAAPLLLLAPFLFFSPFGKAAWRKLLPATVAAFLLALAMGGAGPILLTNLLTYHHPFGPQTMRTLHQPPPGLHPLLVHLKRLPFLLAGIPLFPNEEMRDAVSKWETSLADRIGATEHLDLEGDALWPGVFSPEVKTVDDRFSLAWLFVAAAIGFAALTWRSIPREKRADFLLVLGLALVFGAAIITQTRWQASGAGLPERFLLPVLAFALLATGWMADRLVSLGKIPASIAGAFVGLHALPFLLFYEEPFAHGPETNWRAPAVFSALSEFDAVSSWLPPARKILLVGAQGSRDYPLFRAKEGFANQVVPWGQGGYEKQRLARLLAESHIDTVILAGTESIDMSWDPPINARPFLQDLATRPGFQRLDTGDDLAVFIRR